MLSIRPNFSNDLFSSVPISKHELKSTTSHLSSPKPDPHTIHTCDFPFLDEPSFMEHYQFSRAPSPYVDQNPLILSKPDLMQHSPYRFWKAVHSYILGLDPTGGISESQFREMIRNNVPSEMWNKVMRVKSKQSKTSSASTSSSPMLSLSSKHSKSYQPLKEAQPSNASKYPQKSQYSQYSRTPNSSKTSSPSFQTEEPPSKYILKILFSQFYTVDDRSRDLCAYLSNSTLMTYNEEKYSLVLQCLLSTLTGRINYKLMTVSRRARYLIDAQFFDLDNSTGLTPEYLHTWEKRPETLKLTQEAYKRFLVVLQDVLAEESGTALQDYLNEKFEMERKGRHAKKCQKTQKARVVWIK